MREAIVFNIMGTQSIDHPPLRYHDMMKRFCDSLFHLIIQAYQSPFISLQKRGSIRKIQIFWNKIGSPLSIRIKPASINEGVTEISKKEG